MAVTYYKYAEREADSQVNWAQITKGMTDMLSEASRIREEKKDALDKAQQETLKYLSETPNGEHVGARQSIVEYSDKAANSMRIAQQLLKTGQMSPKDYTIFRQNLTDGTMSAFNANKVYQERFSEVMKGVADKKYSQLMGENFAEVEGFADWKNVGWEIGPNGTVMVGKMSEKEIDGKKVRTLDESMGGLRSVDYLNKALTSTINFYNYEPLINNFVDKFGKNKRVVSIALGRLGSQGKILTRDDIKERDGFLAAEEAKINEIVGDDLDAARILVDSAIIAPNGQPYTTVTDKSLVTDNTILKVVDPDSGAFKYVLNDKQKEDAKSFIRNQMRSKYNFEEDVDVVGQLSEPNLDRTDRDKDSKNAVSMLGMLYYGNQGEVDSAVDYFKGLKNSKGEVLFKNLKRDSSGITVVMRDGTQERISFVDKNGRPRTQEEFIKSAGPLLAGNVDVSSALEKGSYKKGASFNRDITSESSTLEPSSFRIPSSELMLPSQSAVKGIQASLPVGFKAEDTGSIIPFSGRLNNEVTITAPNGAKKVIETKIQGSSQSDMLAREKIAMDIEDFIRQNQVKENKAELD